MLKNQLQYYPQWKHKMVRIFLKDPVVQIYGVRTYNAVTELRMKLKKELIQYSLTRDMIKEFEIIMMAQDIPKKWFHEGKKKVTYNDHIYKAGIWGERIKEKALITWFDVDEQFLAWAKLKKHKHISVQFIERLEEAFNQIWCPEEEKKFDNYLDNWTDRLMNMSEEELKGEIKHG